MRTAKRFGFWLSAGQSNPIVFQDEDDKRWVVKYRNNPQGVRVLANEWINSQLAQLLGLPIPESDFIDLPQELIAAENLRQKQTNQLISSGISYGCRYIEGCNNNPNSHQVQNLLNSTVLPGVVVFDTWVINADRTNNGGNLMVSPDPLIKQKYHFHLIDLGMIIRPDWTPQHLQWGCTDQQIYSMHPSLSAHLTSAPLSYCFYLDLLERIPISKIWNIAYSIPPEWLVPDEHVEALVKYLDQRKKMVRPILERAGFC